MFTSFTSALGTVLGPVYIVVTRMLLLPEEGSCFHGKRGRATANGNVVGLLHESRWYRVMWGAEKDNWRR